MISPTDKPIAHDGFVYRGVDYELDFYDLTDRPLPDYPWDQVYVVGNLDGKVPIVKYAHAKDNLPGGGIKAGETIEQALQREMKEELNMTATDWQIIGYQHVYDKDGNEVYQLRAYANLKKLGEFENDPDGSVIGHELIPIEDLNQHIDYGEVGEFLMKKWRKATKQT